ncbi:hypothetical protein ONZ45_g9740 [Pleurotus djamor]|nr:hypothetical protein ONZ45_g9740 [Pleurotus djamor]
MDRSPTSPLYVVTPYLLCALAVASNSPSLQNATFIAVVGIASFVIRSTMTGKPDDDFGIACLPTGVVKKYQRFPFPSSRASSGHYSSSQARDIFDGQANRPTHFHLRHPTYLLVRLVINVILMDVIGTVLTRFPSVFLDPLASPASFGYTWVYRSVYIGIFIYYQSINISSPHTAWMLALTAMGPLFGSWSHAYTVRMFWGRTWHHLFRRIFKVYGDLVTKHILGLKRGRLTSYIQLYVAFIMSGIIHHSAEFMPVGHRQSQSIRFFLIQAVGIHCEDGIIAVASRLGIRESWFWRALGYLWVWQWLTWTVPFWLHALPQGAPIGIVKLVCSELAECPSILAAT